MEDTFIEPTCKASELLPASSGAIADAALPREHIDIISVANSTGLAGLTPEEDREEHKVKGHLHNDKAGKSGTEKRGEEHSCGTDGETIHHSDIKGETTKSEAIKEFTVGKIATSLSDKST